ncbi:MAG: zinc ribbon domain-containing protein [Candidatus Bathyarchaeia archaeon]
MPFCLKCGGEVPPDVVYCPYCGVKLTAEPPPPPGVERPQHGVVEFPWGKSFHYAVRYILYAILWIIVGGWLMGLG